MEKAGQGSKTQLCQATNATNTMYFKGGLGKGKKKGFPNLSNEAWLIITAGGEADFKCEKN